MGENDMSNKTTPTLVEYLASMDVRVWRVACGASHTVICTEVQEVIQGRGSTQITVTKGGEVMQCGATRALGRFTPRFAIVRKLKGIPVKAIGAGDSHSAAVTTEGELYTWGCNTNGCAAHPVSMT
jgi:alpha-tubulin suppressor-like RCC1 family protein